MFDVAKHNRLGWAGLLAGGLQAIKDRLSIAIDF